MSHITLNNSGVKGEIRKGLKRLVKVKEFWYFHSRFLFLNRFPLTSKVSVNKETRQQTASYSGAYTEAPLNFKPLETKPCIPNSALPPRRIIALYCLSSPRTHYLLFGEYSGSPDSDAAVKYLAHPQGAPTNR